MESSENLENLDEKIKVLNKLLSGLKKERIKSEKQEILFNKRYKVLSVEKELADIKKRNELKSLEKKQIVRANISNDKNELKQKKLNDMQKLEEQRMKNLVLKNKINKSLEWRKRNFSEKNKIEANKIKQEKIKRRQCVNEINEKNLNEKKQIHDNLRINVIRHAQKIKDEKIKKNLIIKTELKNQIEKEIEALQKINKLYKNEDDINEILKLYPNNKNNENNNI